MLFDQNKVDLKYAKEVLNFYSRSHSPRRYITLRTLFRCFIGELEGLAFRLKKLEKAVRRLEGSM